MKNKLFWDKGCIIRVLSIKDNEILIINCSKKSMPGWFGISEIDLTKSCTEEELHQKNNIFIPDESSLTQKEKRIMHERYTIIAPILPFIERSQERIDMTNRIAELKNISKQTIRHYLYLFLVYQSMTVLSSKTKPLEVPLNQHEKNIRWALNKFFYTKHKNSLNTAYTLMLKEKYCINGVLVPEYPSIHQFKYYYRKTKKLQTYYISRNGIKEYQRNHRPLLGDGIQDFASNIGVGMLDATICDIYLVNESGNVIGRPILTACIDAYSRLCCGYSLTWEGGMYSLRNLMINIISNKVKWCKKFGILIKHDEWNCDKLPATFVTDMGSEYKSQNFEQLTELGVSIINLPAYRPELKGAVEKFFDLIQEYYKKHLKGKGIIEPDFRERGAKDYRKEACLTMNDFEKIILYCILYYNSKRIIENFPYTQDMLQNQIKPHSCDIWNWSLTQFGSNLIPVNHESLIFSLLPRTTGKFGRDGLKVNRLRYKNNDYTELYLKGGTATVAYNPDNVSYVWLLEDGQYIKFELIETRFNDMQLDKVSDIKQGQKQIIKSVSIANTQAQINLAEHIESIANSSANQNANIKEIRRTRKSETNKSHIDFTEGVNRND